MISELSLVITYVPAFCTIILALCNSDKTRETLGALGWIHHPTVVVSYMELAAGFLQKGHFQEIVAIHLKLNLSIAFSTARQLLNTSLLKRQVLVHSASRAVDLLPRRPDRAYVASRIESQQSSLCVLCVLEASSQSLW